MRTPSFCHLTTEEVEQLIMQKTIKTPLPEKVSEKYPTIHGGTFTPLSEEAQAINQFIDVVAELTEVMEGWKKQAIELSETQEVERLTFSIKEQLLGRVAKLPRVKGTTHLVNIEDVEATINKLIL